MFAKSLCIFCWVMWYFLLIMVGVLCTTVSFFSCGVALRLVKCRWETPVNKLAYMGSVVSQNLLIFCGIMRYFLLRMGGVLCSTVSFLSCGVPLRLAKCERSQPSWMKNQIVGYLIKFERKLGGQYCWYHSIKPPGYRELWWQAVHTIWLTPNQMECPLLLT